jgi:hypothetical protein
LRAPIGLALGKLGAFVFRKTDMTGPAKQVDFNHGTSGILGSTFPEGHLDLKTLLAENGLHAGLKLFAGVFLCSSLLEKRRGPCDIPALRRAHRKKEFPCCSRPPAPPPRPVPAGRMWFGSDGGAKLQAYVTERTVKIERHGQNGERR